MKKLVIIFVLVFIAFSAFVGSARAAQLSQFSDTITTSRPSAATPLASDQSAGSGSVTIVSDTQNYSIFIASDSASLYADTGETANNSLNVASMSALNIPSSGQRIVYFTNTAANSHHTGDVIAVPITAMHKIQFTTQTAIPIGGKIVITFPGTSGQNTASPSATTFSFNGLSSGTTDISYQLAGGASCTSLTAASPTITCVTTGGTIPGGSTLTFLVGCADGSTNENACSTERPRLINPTKSTSNVQSGASAATVAADNWRINVQTQDGSSVTLDQSTTTIGTIESVQVQASVDPTLTFTITGIASNVNLSSSHGVGCSGTTNSGILTTGTFVNLGLLTSNHISLAAQDLSVATNESAGYVLTATSSGHLINSGSGYTISDPGNSPTYIGVGVENFGIHPCGSDAESTFNPTGPVCHLNDCTSGTGSGADGKLAWPTPTTAIQLAHRNTVTSGIVTTVQYAAAVSGITPAGTYNTVITYVATPTFN